MIKVRKLTPDGLNKLSGWLESPVADTPPADLIDNEFLTESMGNCEIDPLRQFNSRYELGIYLNNQLSSEDFNVLLSPENDGLWAWLAVVYFSQLTAKGIRRSEHYVVVRKGTAGSLAYRHSVRTAYELVHIHGQYAQICLKSPIHTYGDITEQLASRQAIAHNKGFFQIANELYLKDGSLKRGAASKPKKPKDRKPGDRTGFGSVRRLAIALQRLNLTYDTEIMNSHQMAIILPKEFANI